MKQLYNSVIGVIDPWAAKRGLEATTWMVRGPVVDGQAEEGQTLFFFFTFGTVVVQVGGLFGHFKFFFIHSINHRQYDCMHMCVVLQVPGGRCVKAGCDSCYMYREDHISSLVGMLTIIGTYNSRVSLIRTSWDLRILSTNQYKMTDLFSQI